jgi:hypothetical protein
VSHAASTFCKHRTMSAQSPKRIARLRLEHVAKLLEVVLQRPLIGVKRDAANIDGGDLQPTGGRSYNRENCMIRCWHSVHW